MNPIVLKHYRFGWQSNWIWRRTHPTVTCSYATWLLERWHHRWTSTMADRLPSKTLQCFFHGFIFKLHTHRAHQEPTLESQRIQLPSFSQKLGSGSTTWLSTRRSGFLSTTHHHRRSGRLFALLLDVLCLRSLIFNSPRWPTSKKWMEQGQKTFSRWSAKVFITLESPITLPLGKSKSHLPEHSLHGQVEAEIDILKKKYFASGWSSSSRLSWPALVFPHVVEEDILSSRRAEGFESCPVGALALRDQAKTDLPKLLHSLVDLEGTLPYAYITPMPSKLLRKPAKLVSAIDMLPWNARFGQLVGTFVYELCPSIFGEVQPDHTVHEKLDLQQPDAL